MKLSFLKLNGIRIVLKLSAINTIVSATTVKRGSRDRLSKLELDRVQVSQLRCSRFFLCNKDEPHKCGTFFLLLFNRSHAKRGTNLQVCLVSTTLRHTCLQKIFKLFGGGERQGVKSGLKWFAISNSIFQFVAIKSMVYSKTY